jgi:hypothetical protein
MTTLSIGKAGKRCNWDSRRATPTQGGLQSSAARPQCGAGAATGVSAMGYDANKELGKPGPSGPGNSIGRLGREVMKLGDRMYFEPEGETGIELVFNLGV